MIFYVFIIIKSKNFLIRLRIELVLFKEEGTKQQNRKITQISLRKLQK